jgi:undecaprenyl-diphosphatase
VSPQVVEGRPQPRVAAGQEAAPAEPPPTVPETGSIARFDRWVDESVAGPMRGHRTADRVFYAASALGDHGLIWLILAVVRGLTSPDSWRATMRAAAAIGIESALVNGPVKWVFRRSRPLPTGVAAPHPLRTPRTSSFPSGHATSAFCAATLLSDGDPARRPLYFALAAVVAWSRIHVRLHHGSDVIGGVVIGTVLGQVFKRLMPLGGPGRESASRRSG